MNSIFIVQTNDGYYINTESFHSTKDGAEESCAHAMNDCITNESWFEAQKYQIVEAVLEV